MTKWLAVEHNELCKKHYTSPLDAILCNMHLECGDENTPCTSVLSKAKKALFEEIKKITRGEIDYGRCYDIPIGQLEKMFGIKSLKNVVRKRPGKK